MNLFKIVQNRTNKRKQNDNPYQDVGAVLLFVFLLPYVISCLWGHIGEETEVLMVNMQKETNYLDDQYEIILSEEWGMRTLTMEEYLTQKLALVMPQAENGTLYEKEALKAQAILLRTELWTMIEDEETIYCNITQKADTKIQEEYETAVHETDGIILTYQGEPMKAAYFAVSNGQTRDAGQVWGSDSYPYLKKVECKQDILAKDYQSRVEVEKEEFYHLAGEILEIEGVEGGDWQELEFIYDESGYVTKVVLKEASCSGEAFRYAFGLNSACFEMEWEDSKVVFQVKGVGHGFGMSQYGANQRALSGENFAEILENYFFQAELVKIE